MAFFPIFPYLTSTFSLKALKWLFSRFCVAVGDASLDSSTASRSDIAKNGFRALSYLITIVVFKTF